MGFFGALRFSFCYVLTSVVSVIALHRLYTDGDAWMSESVLGRDPTPVESLLFSRSIIGFAMVDLAALVSGLFCNDYRFRVTMCMVRLVACGTSWHVGPVSLARLSKVSPQMPDAAIKEAMFALGGTLVANVIALLLEMGNEPKKPAGKRDGMADMKRLFSEASKVHGGAGASGSGAGKSPAAKSPGKSPGGSAKKGR